MPFQFRLGVGDGYVEWQTGMVNPTFKRRHWKVSFIYLLFNYHTGQTGAGKKPLTRLLNLRFRRSNLVSVVALEWWTSSLPFMGHGS